MSERIESFSIENDLLVRRVVPLRGTPYEHRCSREVFEAVAHAVEEAEGPFVMEDIRTRERQPWTQVAVAMAFLRERGLVERVHGRQLAAAPGYAFEDAMVALLARDAT